MSLHFKACPSLFDKSATISTIRKTYQQAFLPNDTVFISLLTCLQNTNERTMQQAHIHT